MNKQEIIDTIHKTIYQFFDVCGDNEEMPLTDKDKLLLKVNKAICNNLKALEPKAEVSEYDIDHIWYKGGQYISLRRFLEVKAEADQETKWIPISSKDLPKLHKKVLISTTDGEVNKAYRRYKEWTENQYEWVVHEMLGYSYTYTDDEVLAWQSLPEHYKPESEAKKMKIFDDFYKEHLDQL